jgi:2-dehydro-3-deoxyphosphooctonate aldolase (KDO 8-P synthase)
VSDGGASSPVAVGPVTIGGGGPPAVIAGPCVIEELAQTVDLAGRLAAACARRGLGYVFKASFDKANRTALESYRGPGLEAGLHVLAAVQAEVGVPVLTDVHECAQAAVAARVVDALQVPAFLCRQTDLLQACGRTGKPVQIKKGQFMVPADMRYAADKVRAAGGRPLVCERGTAFGYGDLVVDMRSLIWLRAAGCPVVFDGTHSVQQPGAGGHTGGRREMVPPLVRAAVAVGVDALYLEVHPEPQQARCDGPNCLAPERFESLLDEVVRLAQA